MVDGQQSGPQSVVYVVVVIGNLVREVCELRLERRTPPPDETRADISEQPRVFDRAMQIAIELDIEPTIAESMLV